MHTIQLYALAVILLPLCGALFAGLGCRYWSNRAVHGVTIACVTASFVLSLVLVQAVFGQGASFDGTLYTWGVSGEFYFEFGLLIDRLAVLMMAMVTSVATLVHIYSMGYMQEDPSQPRFFAYVSLFTFAMLVLVSANNFFQLFIGWEGVGLVSYLLIGFWFHKPSAAAGSFKAFLVNRIGDLGFMLGMAALMAYVGTLNYHDVVAGMSAWVGQSMVLLPGVSVSVVSLVAVLFFIGAMAKSAQVPLHIWLPESMEGPTPISALIHAATMVTAGVFMVARLSPLFELSQTALTCMLLVGSTGALFLGLLAFVENDIKRIVAYSTMSQLGYMMAANGASAFNVAIFHLLTHAFFKALLFLAAGAVIVAMHHEQDLRKMGNLKRYMPVTYWCFLIGALSLSAIPPFSGYYSKDAVIEAVEFSQLPGATYAYYCLLLGAFVTAFYIFRAFFMAFHTQEKMSAQVKSHLAEVSWSMRLPLIALAIPSLALGGWLAHSFLHEVPGLLGHTVYRSAEALGSVSGKKIISMNVFDMISHTVLTLPFCLSACGIAAAYVLVVLCPTLPGYFSRRCRVMTRVLRAQYGLDYLSDRIVVPGVRAVARFFFQMGDATVLDHYLVNGLARRVMGLSRMMSNLQTGYLYHYLLVMIVSVIGLFVWLLFF